MREPIPKPGTGIVGFGCVTILVLGAGLPLVLISYGATPVSLVVLVAVAVVVGMIAAHFGESVFEVVLRIATWLRHFY